MSRYFAEIRVPPFTKGKKEKQKSLLVCSLNGRYAPLCWVTLGVSLLMLNWYLYVRKLTAQKPQFLGLRKNAGNLVRLSL